MKDENMTFGQFIRSKRLQSRRELTLREMGEQLGISLTMYSEIEQGRKNPGEFFDYEKVARLLELTDEEKALMYDLAARKKRRSHISWSRPTTPRQTRASSTQE